MLVIFIGVDIGSSAVKAVAIQLARQKFYILGTHFFSLKLNATEEENTLLTITHLKALNDLYQHKEVQYIYCFSQKEVSFRRLFFPFKERYKIEKSLSFEMEDKVLFDYQKLISDFKIIASSNKGADVLVFSVFRKRIKEVLQQLKSVGIEPVIVTCEASAMSNVLFGSSHSPLSTGAGSSLQGIQSCNMQLVLKLGYSHTLALVFLDGVCQWVYNFEWGVSSSIRKLAMKYEIPMETAQAQFYEKGFVLTDKRGYTGSQIAFSTIVQDELDRLVHQVHLLLLQLEGEYHWKCEKVFICGGGSQIRNLQVWLSSRWNLPVMRVESVKDLASWNLRTNVDKQNNLLTALGCAMEGLKGGRTQAINFLKEEFAVQFNLAGALPSEWKRSLLLGAFGFILFFTFSYIRNVQSSKLSSKVHTVFEQSAKRVIRNRQQLSLPKVKKFVDSKQHLVEQMQLVEELTNMPSALDGMKDISIAIRKDPLWQLEIQQLDIGQNETKIYGTILKAYLKNLESNLKSIAQEGKLSLLPAKKIKKDSPTLPEDLNNPVPFAYSYTRVRTRGL